MAKKNETAAEAYTRLAVEVNGQLKTLTDALEAHRARHNANPQDWGFAGDLGHVKELIGEVLAFLGSGR